MTALNTDHTNFRCMFTLLNFLEFSCWHPGEWRRADTIGHLGGPRQTAKWANPALPSNVVLCPCLQRRYNWLPGSLTPAGVSGGRDGRINPWHTPICETARRPPGFLEGNRGVPPSRRENGPTVGKARGDARSSSPA